MRTFSHQLTASKSGKSMLFRVTISDRYGEKTITLASVSGWRAELAKRHLTSDSNQWDDATVRMYVGLNALSAARDRSEAIRYIDTVKSIRNAEIHFWAAKFLSNDRTRGAWRALYR